MRWLFVICLSFLGCTNGRVTHLEPVSVSFEPASSDLGAVRVGQVVSAPLNLVNPGLAPVAVTLRAVPDGELQSETLSLQGGERRALVLRFAVAAEGEVVRTVEATTEAGVARAVIRAQGVRPPDCSAQSACGALTEVDGGCVFVPKADGTSCADACLENGACRSGVCAGVERSCDDGNACTVDFCSPLSGCAHVARVCAEPSNPCHASVCTSDAGCSEVEVADGTRCGETDCQTAHICMLGQCTVVTGVPDGVSCTPQTACAKSGKCASGSCQVTETAPDGTRCGEADQCSGQGACSGGLCTFTGAKPDGTPCGDPNSCMGAGTCSGGRCSSAHPVLSPSWTWQGGEFSDSVYAEVSSHPGELLMFAGSGDSLCTGVFQHRDNDGVVIEERVFCSPNDPTSLSFADDGIYSIRGSALEFRSYDPQSTIASFPVANEIDQLLIQAGLPPGAKPLAVVPAADAGTWVKVSWSNTARWIPFDANGQPKTTQLSAVPLAKDILLSPDGRAVVAFPTSAGGFQLAAMNPDGAALWSANSPSAPLALSTSAIYFGDGSVRRLSDGASISVAASGALNFDEMLFSSNPGRLFRRGGVSTLYGYQDESIDLATGELQFSSGWGSDIFQPSEAQLLSDGQLAMVLSLQMANGWYSDEFSGGPPPTYGVCLAPVYGGSSRSLGHIAVLHDWLVVEVYSGSASTIRTVRGYKIPGIAPATGWATIDGSAAHDHRAH